PHAARGLDLVGAGLAVVSLGAATWALTEAGPRGWTDSAVLGAGVLAVAGIASFVWRMLHTHDPLVPPALFRRREFTVTNLATVLMYAALGVSFFLVAYELQVGAGWSALRAGTSLLPATVLLFAVASASGSLAPRIGPRLPSGRARAPAPPAAPPSSRPPLVTPAVVPAPPPLCIFTAPRQNAGDHRPARGVLCSGQAPPLQPDPELCPASKLVA